MRGTHVFAALMGLGTCLWLAGLTAAQEDAKAAGSDAKFIKAAASGGMYEVKSSEMAKDSATSDAVKKFAHHMVEDHTKANKELMGILKKENIAAPTEMAEKERKNIDALSKLKGADFDREFIRQQLAAHKDTVALFEDEAKSGKDTDLRAFAEKTLPTLREHLKEVTQLAGSERPSR